jgi:hypothetical protein
MAHTCNPNYLGGRDLEAVVQDQLWQNVSKIPISINKPVMVVCACHPSYV